MSKKKRHIQLFNPGDRIKSYEVIEEYIIKAKKSQRYMLKVKCLRCGSFFDKSKHRILEQSDEKCGRWCDIMLDFSKVEESQFLVKNGDRFLDVEVISNPYYIKQKKGRIQKCLIKCSCKTNNVKEVICKNFLRTFSLICGCKIQEQENKLPGTYLFNGIKQCRKCEKFKDASEFSKYWPSKDGLYRECKLCNRENKMILKYGINLEEYEQILIKQNNKCKICGTDNPKGTTNVFKIDHCHKTNKIRGLLCDQCNLGIGHFRDSIENLQSAINYLEKFRQSL